MACPVKIIHLHLGEDGFYHPKITEKDKCVHCGICLDVCAYAHEETALTTSPIGYFSAWSKDEATRRNSTSGGVITELSRFFLHNGYGICAASYDPKSHLTRHIIATDQEALEQCVGSKYMQSNFVEDSLAKMEAGKNYLVIGTPCQIDSFRRYIRHKRIEGNFLLADFFCHGVPSIRMWHKYLAMTGMRDIQQVHFRDKQDGWHEASYRIVLENGKKTWNSKLTDGDLFYRFFLGNRCLNAACYDKCMFKADRSSADIRLGDMWGQKYAADRLGVNTVITFTRRGQETLALLESCQVNSEGREDALGDQMRKNATRPPSYRYVTRMLRTQRTLPSINRGAGLRELPDRLTRVARAYTRWFLNRMHPIKK